MAGALSLPQLYIYEAIRNKNGSGWRMLGRIGSTLLVCHTTNMYVCMCVQLKVMQNIIIIIMNEQGALEECSGSE